MRSMLLTGYEEPDKGTVMLMVKVVVSPIQTEVGAAVLLTSKRTVCHSGGIGRHVYPISRPGFPIGALRGSSPQAIATLSLATICAPVLSKSGS